MQKAGGIIAIIAGVFAILASGITLIVGGISSAVKSAGAGQVLTFGWYGLGFAFLVVVLGAVGISTQRKLVGLLLIVASCAGAILGGTLVALFMVLSLVAGILIMIGAKKVRPVAIPIAP